MKLYKFSIKTLLFFKNIIKRFSSIVKYGPKLDTGLIAFGRSNLEKKTDIVFVIAAHQRKDILIQTIIHHLNCCNNDMTISMVVVISHNDSLEPELIPEHIRSRLIIICCSNQPLGNKWQTGVNFAKRVCKTSVMICGSDDFISETYIKEAYRLINNNKANLVGTNQWQILDCKNKLRLYEATYSEQSLSTMLGAGRLYSKSFLDSINWEIFEKLFSKGLDYKGLNIATKIKQDKILFCKQGIVISVKGEWEMLNSVSLIKQSPLITVTDIDLENKVLDKTALLNILLRK